MIRSRFAPLLLATIALAGCNSANDSTPPAASAEAIKAIAAPAGTKWTDKVATTPEGGVLRGNPDAPVKLIEYGSLSCPACAKLAQDGYAKLDEYIDSGRVNLEFRSFMMHPPQDVPLTLLSRCGPLETFFPLVEQIYANFEAMQAPLSDQAVAQAANAALQSPPEQRMANVANVLKFTEFFAARGLPADKANACLRDMNKIKDLSDLTQKYASDGVNSTPTLVLNGNKLDTAKWSDVDLALQQAGVR